jgi:hypothetical protein
MAMSYRAKEAVEHPLMRLTLLDVPFACVELQHIS